MRNAPDETLLWLVMLVGIAVQGWAISLTWGWFISPVTQWRAISLAEGVGLAMFASIIRPSSAASFSKSMVENLTPSQIIWMGSFRAIVMPLIGVAMAWVWYRFVIL